jgi:hypothetical protein
MDWEKEFAAWIVRMYTEYRIVDVDPILRACAEWFMTSWGGWLARNALAVSIIANVLAWLKIRAIRTPSVADDRIVGYLQWLFTGPWRQR